MSDYKQKEIKRLHDLGFAIHLLKPKSKIPVKPGWSGDSKDSVKVLMQEFRPNLNIGTKLGKPSLISTSFGDEGYLAVIDVDVKGIGEKHKKAAEQKVEEIFPGLLESAPITHSGRGNGSLHIWCLVDSPIDSKKITSSNEIIEVMMPSTKASKFDIEKLGQEKINQGWRLRPAWEIDFMCAGRQVVLPPSIHPDTGMKYRWHRAIKSADDLSFVDVKEILSKVSDSKSSKSVGRPSGSATNSITPIDVDELELELRLRPDVVNAIIDGDGVNDRSAMCFSVAMHMIRAGFSEGEIVGVLTQKEYFLGEVAYEHSKSSSRLRAIKWIEKYCLDKAKIEVSGVKDFESEVEIYETLGEDESQKQHKKLVKNKKEIDWRLDLDRTDKDKLKTTFKNVKLILENVVGENVFVYDIFALRQTYGMNTPWGGIKGVDITDLDEIKIKSWLAHSDWKIEPPVNIIGEVINQIASKNTFHPVRDYLESLEWDGVPRLDNWMETYLGAKGHPDYIKAVSRKFLVAAVARVYQPGIKFDHMPILEGIQGVGKSTVGRILASSKWFYDSDLNLHDKDSSLNLQGQWIVEMGELANISKADVRQIKSYVVREVDKVRPPYGKRMVESPRQCVFFGTTNDDAYLKDKSGNRRFLPIEVSTIDLKSLRKDRDQLWAEALIAYDFGEDLFFTKEIEALAKGVQETKVVEDVSDVMVDCAQEWWEKVKSLRKQKLKNGEKLKKLKFKLKDFFGDFSGFDDMENMNPPFKDFKFDSQFHVQTASFALHKIGFFKKHFNDGNWWVRKN